MQYTPEDLDIATRTVWGEARGEGPQGQLAVAWVIRNRAEEPGWWGKTPAQVCQKPYQFSCWLESDPNSKKLAQLPTSDPLYARIRDIVREAFEGTAEDPTGGATHYKVKGIKASWDKATVDKTPAEIGHHLFFKIGL
jgi:spore germination cell wall hydrolase CwlJ-like protein